MIREAFSSLCVTALIVVSVVGGSVLVAGTVTAESDTATDVRQTTTDEFAGSKEALTIPTGEYHFSTNSGIAFGQSTYSEARGDIVNISVLFGTTDNVTVQIGTSERNSYNITAEVVDDNDDGIAYLEFNTFEAGAGGVTPDDVLTVNNGDTIRNVQQGGTFTTTHPGTAGTDMLDPGYYEILVKAGQREGQTIRAEDGVGAISLTKRSTEDVNIWTAPAGTTVSDTGDITKLAENGSLTKADTVADGDMMVVAVEANGLEGMFDTTEQYQSITAAEEFFALSFKEASGTPNGDTESHSISEFDSEDVTVLYNDTDSSEVDTHYVAIDSNKLTEAFSDHEAGTEYDAIFRVFAAASDNDLGGSYESISDTAAIEAPSAELNTDANDEVVLNTTTGQTISGETTVAPGTELELEFRSDDATPAFFNETTPTVTANRTFTSTVTLAQASPGDNFTVTVQLGTKTISDSYDGYILAETDPAQTNTSSTTEAPSSTVNGTETAETTATAGMETDTGSQTTDTGSQTTDTETPVITTSAEAPGFTAIVGIAALIAAGLLGARRRTESE